MEILSEDEELRFRKHNFKKLTTGKLFNLGNLKYFLAVEKNSEDSWKVIELTPVNIERIIKGGSCEISILKFEEMYCLNLK